MLTAMRVSVTLIDPRWDVREDVVIDADDATPTAAVIDELLAVLASPALDQADVIPLTARTAAAPERRTHTLYHHGEPLDTSLPLAESGLKEGSLLSLDDPTASIVVEPDGLVEIRVVSGPGAGAVHRLTAGDATIGSDPSCVLPLPDDRLPAVCLLVSVGHDGATTVSPVDGETAGRARPGGPCRWRHHVAGRRPARPRRLPARARRGERTRRGRRGQPRAGMAGLQPPAAAARPRPADHVPAAEPAERAGAHRPALAGDAAPARAGRRDGPGPGPLVHADVRHLLPGDDARLVPADEEAGEAHLPPAARGVPRQEGAYRGRRRAGPGRRAAGAADGGTGPGARPPGRSRPPGPPVGAPAGRPGLPLAADRRRRPALGGHRRGPRAARAPPQDGPDGVRRTGDRAPVRARRRGRRRTRRPAPPARRLVRRPARGAAEPPRHAGLRAHRQRRRAVVGLAALAPARPPPVRPGHQRHPRDRRRDLRPADRRAHRDDGRPTLRGCGTVVGASRRPGRRGGLRRRPPAPLASGRRGDPQGGARARDPVDLPGRGRAAAARGGLGGRPADPSGGHPEAAAGDRGRGRHARPRRVALAPARRACPGAAA